jgi:ATP-dependent exoDNAse (exonuclease V) alpha subunit
MGLNSGQVIGVNGTLDAYEEGKPGFTIIGEGGTGKTYCVMEIVSILLDGQLKVLLVAPTNKAVKQLEKAARSYKLPLDKIGFKTAHSALGLSLMPTAEKKYAARVRDSVLPEYNVVVCDEMSMLGEAFLFDYFLPDLKEYNVFCLMMGDDMQLPPVKETSSKAFGIFPTAELTQVERQQNNPDGTPNGILQITAPLRAAIKAKETFDFNYVPANNVTVVKAANFLHAVVEQFDLTTDLEEVRVLAWRNRRVDDINNAIRDKIYGKNAARFEIGERLVTGKPIQKGGDIVLSTDEESLVAAVSESVMFDEGTETKWKTWLVTLNPVYADVKQVFAHVLHESEYDRFRRHCNALVEKAEEAKKTGKNAGWHWKQLHTFQDLFADLKYCYCITVHRSQGSTFKRVMVDVKDLLDNPVRSERQRLLYVAFSRPQQELLINKVGFKA